MMRQGLGIAAAAGALIWGYSVAQAEPAGESGERAWLRQEVVQLRRELADIKLQLRQTLSELDELRQFLSTEDAAVDIDRWRHERRALQRERQETAQQRMRLEQLRLDLRQAARVHSDQLADQLDTEAAQAMHHQQPQWDVDYKIVLIRTDLEHEYIIVEPTDGDILIERYPSIDPKQILLRGTFRNRSAQSWRYTFEVRLGDSSRRIIGHWRYQTPALGSNELHAFEITVPVTHVSLIRTYQIGNVTADRPVPVAADGKPEPVIPDAPLKEPR